MSTAAASTLVTAATGGSASAAASGSSASAASGRSASAAPTPGAALSLLAVARRGVAEAELARTPTERYAAAHLAALRAAAAVLAARARPATSAGRRSRPLSVWTLLAGVAPEMGEWAEFFAAGARKRALAEAGLPGSVTTREADDLLRDATTFLAVVETKLRVPRQPALSAVRRL